MHLLGPRQISPLISSLALLEPLLSPLMPETGAARIPDPCLRQRCVEPKILAVLLLPPRLLVLATLFRPRPSDDLLKRRRRRAVIADVQGRPSRLLGSPSAREREIN
jgi:hypothetical protein